MTEDVRHRQVVPSTTFAHFAHKDPEFTIFTGHVSEFTVGWLDTTGIRSEFVAVDAGDIG